MFLRGSKKNLGKKRIKTVKGLHSLTWTSQTGIRNIGVYVLIQKGAKNKEVDCFWMSKMGIQKILRAFILKVNF